jgi:hypothetical protein
VAPDTTDCQHSTIWKSLTVSSSQANASHFSRNLNKTPGKFCSKTNPPKNGYLAHRVLLMNDPLKLQDLPTTGPVRIARVAPHRDVEGLYCRITNGSYADSSDVRLVLLAHLVYIAYCDLKETLTP